MKAMARATRIVTAHTENCRLNMTEVKGCYVCDSWHTLYRRINEIKNIPQLNIFSINLRTSLKVMLLFFTLMIDKLRSDSDWHGRYSDIYSHTFHTRMLDSGHRSSHEVAAMDNCNNFPLKSTQSWYNTCWYGSSLTKDMLTSLLLSGWQHTQSTKNNSFQKYLIKTQISQTIILVTTHRVRV